MPQSDYEFLRQLLIDVLGKRLDDMSDDIKKLLEKVDDHDARIQKIETINETVENASTKRANRKAQFWEIGFALSGILGTLLYFADLMRWFGH